MNEPTAHNDNGPKQPASTQSAGKKRPPTKTSWRPGQSGNPAGRRPSGQSWKEIFKVQTEKTRDELLAEMGGSPLWLTNYLKKLPAGIPMKQLIALYILVELMQKPTAGLLNAVLNSELPAAPDEGSGPSEPGESEDSADGES